MERDFVGRWFNVEALESCDFTIVAIDRACRIRWVNPAWHRFAVANGAPDVQQRYGNGSFYLQGVTPPLRSFFETGFAVALARREIFEQIYECSSPQIFRQFFLRALPLGSEGLLLEHSRVVEHPHCGVPSDLPPASYARTDGTILQCSNCRRVRRAEGASWDWVPAWTKAPPPYTSHGLCAACSAFYWGVK
ncbi:MAG: hypothetical protein WBY94_27630 [Polyangiaceae bacterium]